MLIHLIQREKKRVIEFPSLMFVRRIPYQSVRRRRIRHWALLLMRAAAIALIVAAFARPFLHQGAIAAAAGGGAREIVILLDQSASMGYGDHWTRAKDAARTVVRGLGADDRATLVLFNKNAEENMRATSDRTRLEGAINAAKVGSGATRYGPALKLAESILSRSPIKRREAVLISDFQRSGWSGSEEVRFPEGMTVSTVSVASPNTANLAVPSVAFARSSFSGQERLTVTAGLSNKGDEALKDVPVTLTIDGHEIQTEKATVAAHASGSVSFTQFTLSSPNVRGFVRAGTDPLPADNTFNFVLAPSEPVSLVIVDSGDRADVEPVPVEGAVDRHDAGLPGGRHVGVAPDAGGARQARGRHPERHDVSAGRRRRRAEEIRRARRRAARRQRRSHHLAAGRSGAAAGPLRRDRRSHDGTQRLARLPGLQPSGVRGVQGAAQRRLLRRARLPLSRAADRARPTASSRATTMARWRRRRRRSAADASIVWTTTLDDSWTDIAVKPVFLPLVHQLVRYLAHYEPPTSWLTVGQVLDLTARAKGRGDRSDRIVVTPSGERISQSSAGEGNEGLLELNEQGIYEIRSTGAASGRPEAIAVNLDPAESDLERDRPARAGGRGHRTRDPDRRAAGAVSRDDARGIRAAAEPLVVSADGRLAAARGRNGDRESPVAQRKVPVIFS